MLQTSCLFINIPECLTIFIMTKKENICDQFSGKTVENISNYS